MGKKNYLKVLTYAHDLMKGEVLDHGLPFRKNLNAIATALSMQLNFCLLQCWIFRFCFQRMLNNRDTNTERSLYLLLACILACYFLMFYFVYCSIFNEKCQNLCSCWKWLWYFLKIQLEVQHKLRCPYTNGFRTENFPALHLLYNIFKCSFF